jgi:hypothetical protein
LEAEARSMEEKAVADVTDRKVVADGISEGTLVRKYHF